MAFELPDLRRYGYAVTAQLGRGSDGRVYKASYHGQPKGDLRSGDKVAIKITPCERVRPNEVLLQAQIQHSNVIRLYDVFRVDDSDGGIFLAIVMEIADPSTYNMSGSSLGYCIESVVSSNMNRVVYQQLPDARLRSPIIGGEPMIRCIFLQIVTALDYLHRHPLGICIRDVKPENVLVERFEQHADDVPRPVCKIADFGFSKALKFSESATRCGTAYYVAPEVYLFNPDHDKSFDGKKADVWSAGILLYTLFTGLHPFQFKHDDEGVVIMQRATKKRYVEDLFKRATSLGGSQELLQLLRGMLAIDPAERLSMRQVTHHSWSKLVTQDVQRANVANERVESRLPDWDEMVQRTDRLVDEAHTRQAGNAARPHGWSLPYSYRQVSDVRFFS